MTGKHPLVSVIMPAFNAGEYISEAIHSVLRQSYSNVELLIINDGSSDNTEAKILNFVDSRISYFKQENLGVSAARNTGLERMSGEFFCFLDADDVLPAESLSSRMKVFEENPAIDFLDGIVLKMNAAMSEVKSERKPQFHGVPLIDLVRLTGKCFFGPSWLIRRKQKQQYKFQEGLSHGEDLLFFMELARLRGYYTFVEAPVLHYRDTAGSAMKNIERLERGYRDIEQIIVNWNELSSIDLLIFKYRWRKFMALDYIKRGAISKVVGLFR